MGPSILYYPAILVFNVNVCFGISQFKSVRITILKIEYKAGRVLYVLLDQIDFTMHHSRCYNLYNLIVFI